MAEPEDTFHGAQHDLEHLAEIQGGRDLRGDLLNDANVVRALREIAIEAVDRRLVAGDLLAEVRGLRRARAHAPVRATDPAVKSPPGESAPGECARRAS